MPRWRSFATGAIATAIATAGCSSPTVHLGADPDFLWWTDNESGDTSDWSSGGPLAGHISSTGPPNQLWASTDQARSGHYSLRASIFTGGGFPSGGPPSSQSGDGVLAVRASGLPSLGYYSAWYYLPDAAFPGLSGYWIIFKFRSRTSPTDLTSELWDIDLGPLSGGPGGLLALDLYRFTGSGVMRQPRVANPPAVPINRWFQIEALYRAAPDATGELTVWQDGVPVFELDDQPTAPSNYVEWSVGSVSNGLTPPAATLYIDDAAVSLRRLGPSFPPFSSNN